MAARTEVDAPVTLLASLRQSANGKIVCITDAITARQHRGQIAKPRVAIIRTIRASVLVLVLAAFLALALSFPLSFVVDLVIVIRGTPLTQGLLCILQSVPQSIHLGLHVAI